MREKVTYGLVMARISLEIEIGRKMPEEMHVHREAGMAHDKFGQLRTELGWCLGLAIKRDKDFVCRLFSEQRAIEFQIDFDQLYNALRDRKRQILLVFDLVLRNDQKPLFIPDAMEVELDIECGKVLFADGCNQKNGYCNSRLGFDRIKNAWSGMIKIVDHLLWQADKLADICRGGQNPQTRLVLWRHAGLRRT